MPTVAVLDQEAPKSTRKLTAGILSESSQDLKNCLRLAQIANAHNCEIN